MKPELARDPFFRRSNLRAKVEFDHIFRMKYFLMGSFDILGIAVRMRMGDDVKGVRYSLPDKVVLGCGTWYRVCPCL